MKTLARNGLKKLYVLSQIVLVLDTAKDVILILILTFTVLSNQLGVITKFRLLRAI